MAEADIQRQIAVLARRIERLRKTDVPGIRLPYAQRVLNPFPLASSGATAGDFPQSRAVVVLAFNVNVYVGTPNNGTNYWSVTLANDAGVALATVNTSAISANTWAQLTASSITQPAVTNKDFPIIVTATGNPGAIYLVPELIVA